MITVRWDGEGRFVGGSIHAPPLTVDCSRRAAPGPVDAVVVALASCAAVDVLEILRKRRTPPVALHVEAEHERAERAPRRLLRVHLRFVVQTAASTHHVHRAVHLAVTRYCSVAASLAPDIPITTAVEVVPLPGPAGAGETEPPHPNRSNT